MSTAAMVVEMVGAGLTLLAQIAPSVAAAFTGGRPVQDVIADAHKAVEALPQREATGGDSTAGTWDRNLAGRTKGGTKP
jgi:hypothetical protein